MANTAEFDAYVADYEAQHRDSIRLSGEAPDYFADYKIRTLRRFADKWGMAAPHILDFGAGMGASIPGYRRYFDGSRITLADVSADSLAAAHRLHGGDETYLHIPGREINVPARSVDIVFTACVFHHIPHVEHDRWLRELRRIVRPGGRLVLWEHNPLNPLTRHAVRNCPFDVNAHLIGAREMRRRLSAAGWKTPRLSFQVFFPASAAALRPAEPHLGWLPLGAQYACIGEAPL